MNFTEQNTQDEGEDNENSAHYMKHGHAQAQVEILKVPNQNKYCVNFSRKAGCAMLFYDQVTKYLAELDLCNNATLDSN